MCGAREAAGCAFGLTDWSFFQHALEKDLQTHKINPTWQQERKWESCDATLWLLSGEQRAPFQAWSIAIYKKWAFRCTYTLFRQDKFSTREEKRFKNCSHYWGTLGIRCVFVVSKWKTSYSTRPNQLMWFQQKGL